MRAITLWQPHATLLVTPSDDDPTVPVKKIENRPRPIPSTLTLPVRVGIHAARRPFGFGSPEADVIRDLLTLDEWGQMRDQVNGDPELHRNYPLGALVGFVTFTEQHHADECQREYVCINGHRRDDRGRQLSGQFLSPLPKDRYAFECAEPGCEAEAEPERNLCSRWAQLGQWHYTPRYPIPLADPVPMRGYQGWWTLPDEVLS